MGWWHDDLGDQIESTFDVPIEDGGRAAPLGGIGRPEHEVQALGSVRPPLLFNANGALEGLHGLAVGPLIEGRLAQLNPESRRWIHHGRQMRLDLGQIGDLGRPVQDELDQPRSELIGRWSPQDVSQLVVADWALGHDRPHHADIDTGDGGDELAGAVCTGQRDGQGNGLPGIGFLSLHPRVSFLHKRSTSATAGPTANPFSAWPHQR